MHVIHGLYPLLEIIETTALLCELALHAKDTALPIRLTINHR